MSGGSFDYLCYAYQNGGIGSLIDYSDELHAMAKALCDYPDARRAIDATRQLLAMIDNYDRAVREIIEVRGLMAVWKAVEWQHSADWDQQAVIDAIQAYNKAVTDELR